VRRIIPITAAFAGAGAAAALLPPGARGIAWMGLAVAWLSAAAWGSVRLDSGIFVGALTRGRGDRREVALTFDDGPDPAATPALLDLLKERSAPAAFFLVGERALAAPAVARRCALEGHLVGNHSHRHSVFTNFLFRGPLLREIGTAQSAIAAAAGVRPRHYRPPFGLANHALAGAASALGLRVVGWDVRGLDGGRRAPDRVVRRVLRRARPGSVILLHDGGREPGPLVETVRRILDGLAEKGLEPVSLEMLDEAMTDTKTSRPDPEKEKQESEKTRKQEGSSLMSWT